MFDTAYLLGHGRVATTMIALGVKRSLAFRFQRHLDKLARTRGTRGASAWLESFGNQVSNRLLKTNLPVKVWVSKEYLILFKRVKKRCVLERLTKIKRCITEQQITAEQAGKFNGAVGRDEPSFGSLCSAASYIERGIESMRHVYPLKHNWVSPSCFVPYFKREMSRGYDENEAMTRSLRKIRRDVCAVNATGQLNNRHIVQALSPLNLEEISRVACSHKFKEDDEVAVGTVNVAQEPGRKARFSASPRLIYQYGLKPLQSWLMYGLHRLPEDGCYNASQCLIDIMEHLKAGHLLFCFDLSSATDTFPAYLTWLYLRLTRAIPEQILDLLINVSEGIWEPSESMRRSNFFEKFILWRVGQPLGTGPSFGAFSHTHHALIRGIAITLNRPVDCYVLIGDDVVIFDAEVARVYREIMQLLGVEISLEKSVISNRIAEFGGATICRSHYFYPGKWRVVNDNSLMTFITDPAFDHERVTPKLWNRLIKRMLETPYPFGLNRPDLEMLDERELQKFSNTIQLLFYSKLFSTVTGEGTSDLIDDHHILLRMFHDPTWVATCFPRQDERLSRVRGRDSRHCVAAILAEGDGALDKDFIPEKGSITRLKLRGESLFTLLEEQELPELMEGSGRVATEAEMEAWRDKMILMDDRISRCMVAAASLINSIILSASDEKVCPLDWVNTTPILRRNFSNSLKEPDQFDLVNAVISKFPFYLALDLNPVQPRFVAMLRRYSLENEVLPPLRTPLPRIMRG